VGSPSCFVLLHLRLIGDVDVERMAVERRSCGGAGVDVKDLFHFCNSLPHSLGKKITKNHRLWANQQANNLNNKATNPP
jgi:hypothetical protein